MPWKSPFITPWAGFRSRNQPTVFAEQGEKLTELNYLLFKMPESESDAIAFGKEHYPAIAKLRETLETILAADMLDMHKVGRFLRRRKTRKSGFRAVQLYPPDRLKPS